MKKTKKTDYYTCSRCEIHSGTKGQMCPCPRGGCEAKISGTIIVTTEITLNKKLTKAQKDWNKKNYR